MELMFTMWPDLCCRIPGRTAWVHRKPPKKFVSITLRNTPSSTSSTGPSPPMPALFTSTSILPRVASTSSIPRRTLSSESTSNRTTLSGSFSAAASSASSGAPSGLRMAATTSWPARAIATAVENPIPVLHPVIRAMDTNPPPVLK